MIINSAAFTTYPAVCSTINNFYGLSSAPAGLTGLISSSVTVAGRKITVDNSAYKFKSNGAQYVFSFNIGSTGG